MKPNDVDRLTVRKLAGIEEAAGYINREIGRLSSLAIDKKISNEVAEARIRRLEKIYRGILKEAGALP